METEKTGAEKNSQVEQLDYDVVVIGAGPGGYVAAIRCAQLGLKTACVDEWRDHQGQSQVGGTCLNVGCIPSKALLESSHLYAKAKHELTAHGIHLDAVKLDLEKMQARKNRVVKELTQGIVSLFKANRVAHYSGRGKIKACDVPGKHCVFVKQRKTKQHLVTLVAKNIIVATGSSPVRLPQAPLVDDYILDSAGALEMKDVPKKLAIIGAGAIGLELASIWQRLGSKVVLFEAMQGFLPAVDDTISRQALRLLTKQGLDIRTGHRLISAQQKNKKVQLVFEQQKDELLGKEKIESFDKLVVAVGRKPNSERVFGKEFAVETSERGYLLVNKKCETSIPGVYAIGDVVGGLMLAHKASEEGVMVAHRIAGEQRDVSYELIPSVIYCHPEIAWVGRNEMQCKAEGIAYKTGQFPLSANGRARAAAETDGLVKIISDAKTDRILGVHALAIQASEIIAQAVIAMEMQATSEDLALTMFAHPTLSEALHEAAMSLHHQAIHIRN